MVRVKRSHIKKRGSHLQIRLLLNVFNHWPGSSKHVLMCTHKHTHTVKAGWPKTFCVLPESWWSKLWIPLSRRTQQLGERLWNNCGNALKTLTEVKEQQSVRCCVDISIHPDVLLLLPLSLQYNNTWLPPLPKSLSKWSIKGFAV